MKTKLIAAVVAAISLAGISMQAYANPGHHIIVHYYTDSSKTVLAGMAEQQCEDPRLILQWGTRTSWSTEVYHNDSECQ